MAPIIAFRTVPPCIPGSYDRTVHAAGELLQPAEKAARVDNNRLRLDQGSGGIGFHRVHQADDRVAGHQAVRVKNDHIVVGCAKSSDPLGDVSGLPGGVVRAMSVVEPFCCARAAQLDEGQLLAYPGVRRSEEHTSELQSLTNLVCRLLLEKKNINTLGDQTTASRASFCNACFV